MFELSAADAAGKAWLNTAFHTFVQTQRFSPFVYLAAIFTRVDYRARRPTLKIALIAFMRCRRMFPFVLFIT